MLGTAACGSSSGGGSVNTDAESAGGSAQETTQASDTSVSVPEDDMNEHVNLTMYLLDSACPREQACIDEINMLLEKDLNCSLTVYHISSVDSSSQYQLLFSSGEDFDMAYAGTWMSFASMAQKGAFMPLEDLLPVYCADAMKVEPQEALDQATINGHIYAFPSNFYTYNAYGFCVRGDIMDRYGVSEIKDYEDYMNLCEKVHADDTSFTDVAGVGTNEVFGDIYLESHGLYPLNGGQYGMYYLDRSEEGSPKVIAAHEWDGYEEYLEKAKKWCDDGMWPQSVLSATDGTADLIKSGASIGGLANFDQAQSYYAQVDKSWDLRWYNVQTELNHLPFTQDAMVLPATCPHPARALKVINKIRTDEQYYMLFAYGVEGVDYKLDENNRVTMLNPKEHWAEDGTWGMRTNEFFKVPADGRPDYEETKAGLEEKTVPNIWRSFNMNTDPVKTEYAAMQDVYSQYNAPLRLGITSDVKGDLKQLSDKAAAAGNDKVRAELQEQVDEFYEAHKDEQ